MVGEAAERQRRGRKIAMDAGELDAFLGSERTCRLATVGADGWPHVTPVWFVWQGGALWLSSLIRSQRWADVAREPRVSAVVDAGETYLALRGVEITGPAGVVGDVPRTTAPDAALAEPERLFARKYGGVEAYVPDGRHAWLRVVPEKLVSWDFRKNPALRALRG